MGGARGWLGFVLGLAVVGGCPRALAEEAATSDRVARLEEALRRQSEEMARLRSDLDAYRSTNPHVARLSEDEIRAAVDGYLAASPAPFVPVASASSRGGLRWGGYLTLEMLDATNTNSTFDLHRLVLDASGSITDRIEFNMELEIEHGGISDEIDGEIKVEQAVVSFHCADAFVPKVGWLLIPFGYYNLHHDDPLNDFTLRPFTARYLLPTGFGQPGIGAEGYAPVCGGHVLHYDVAFTNGYSDDFSASRGVREAIASRDTNDGKQLWGRVAMTWNLPRVFDHLETGVSGTWGVYDEADEHALLGVALDFVARKGAFEVKGEWLSYDLERGANDPVDAIEGMSALYVEAAYHFFPGFWRCHRNCVVTDTSLFTLAVRYQWMDTDDQNLGAAFEDDLEAFSVGLNYRITESTVFRVDHTWYRPHDGDLDTEAWAASFSTYF